MKCTQDNCNEEATQTATRGDEKIPYCERHFKALDRIMGALGL